MPWGLDVATRVGSPSVKLLVDLYHAQLMDGNLTNFLRQHMPLTCNRRSVTGCCRCTRHLHQRVPELFTEVAAHWKLPAPHPPANSPR